MGNPQPPEEVEVDKDMVSSPFEPESDAQPLVIESVQPTVAAIVTVTTEGERPVPLVEEEDVEIDRSPDGRFVKFKKEVGRGSFKTVYKGQDSNSGAAVAWLELQPHKINKEDRDRFRAEAEILKKLKHTNIVQFYDSFEKADKATSLRSIVLVTELMTSGTLKTYLKRFKVIRSRPLKSWSRQILQGLKYLHSRNPVVLHRDLKCDNIFVTGTSGVVKIGDLGLATIKRHGVAKSVIGTPEFMAPEMYDENYSEPADVYAFGMCLLEMVTNEYPYEECANPTQIYRLVVKGTLPKAFEKVEDERIKHIIKSCIEFDPTARATVSELLDNDFFDDKELNVLVVGRDGAELKLRLVVYEGNMKKAMPEDEAIDFNFTIGQDTAYQVAQSMSVESTLKTEFVPQVAKAIMDAVDKTKKKDLEEKEKKDLEEKKPTLPEEPTDSAPLDETPPPTTDKKPDIKPVKIDGKGNEKARRAKNKRLAVTVISLKPLWPDGKEDGDENSGWEVTVRVTAGDVTTIVFKVERQRQEDEAATQLANEIIKSEVVPENKRENIEKLLLEIINRLLRGKLTNGGTGGAPAIKWNGCNRADDENKCMEIEVEVDSIRHVPLAKIKYTATTLHQQIENLKTQGIILEQECKHVFEEFSRILHDSLEKMGTEDEIKEIDGLSFIQTKNEPNLTKDQRPKSLHIDITPRKREPELVKDEKEESTEVNNISNENPKVSVKLEMKPEMPDEVKPTEVEVPPKIAPEPIIETKGRFVFHPINQESEPPIVQSCPLQPQKSTSNMNDGATQTDNEDEGSKTLHKEDQYRGDNLSEMKKKLSNLSKIATKPEQEEKMNANDCLCSAGNPSIPVGSNTSSNADDETEESDHREDVATHIISATTVSIKELVRDMSSAYAGFVTQQNEQLQMIFEQTQKLAKNVQEATTNSQNELNKQLDRILSKFDSQMHGALEHSKYGNRTRRRVRKSTDLRREGSDSSEEAFKTRRDYHKQEPQQTIHSTSIDRAPSVPQEAFHRSSPTMPPKPHEVPNMHFSAAQHQPPMITYHPLQPSSMVNTLPYMGNLVQQYSTVPHIDYGQMVDANYGPAGTKFAESLAKIMAYNYNQQMPVQMVRPGVPPGPHQMTIQQPAPTQRQQIEMSGSQPNLQQSQMIHQQPQAQQSRSIPADMSTSGSVHNHPDETAADRTKQWVAQIKPQQELQQDPQPQQQSQQQQQQLQVQAAQQQAALQHQHMIQTVRRNMDPVRGQVVSPPVAGAMPPHSQMQPMQLSGQYQLPSHQYPAQMIAVQQQGGQSSLVAAQNIQHQIAPQYHSQQSMPPDAGDAR